MKLIKVLFCVLIAINLIGCTHKIVISPNTENIKREQSAPPKIKVKVGVFISPDMRNLEITSPSGGGDNIRYFPYRDFETGYQRMLLNVYDNVTILNSECNSYEMSKNGINFTLVPDLTTTSESTGFFTWPPTRFTVDLTSKIRDVSGENIGNPRVIGNGQVAGLSEFKNKDDFGLAGRRAMEDALMKMQRVLLGFRYENSPASSVKPILTTESGASPPSKEQISNRLENLKYLFNRGLINKDEYEHKRKEIVDDL